MVAPAYSLKPKLVLSGHRVSYWDISHEQDAQALACQYLRMKGWETRRATGASLPTPGWTDRLWWGTRHQHRSSIFHW
jgi:hypothetical protein